MAFLLYGKFMAVCRRAEKVSIVEKVRDEKIIVLGTGLIAKRFCLMNTDYEIECFIDNDEEKQGNS